MDGTLFREKIQDRGFLEGMGPSDGEDALSFIRDIRELLVEERAFPVVEVGWDDDSEDFIFFFGDTHGDLETVRNVWDMFLRSRRMIDESGMDGQIKLVFLGDYVDRPPSSMPNGGLLTLLFLLSMKQRYPGNVHLLRGNHEAFDLTPFTPYELPMEIMDIFQGDVSRMINSEVTGLFSDLPLFLKTSNGILSSHAGFPREDQGSIHDIRRGDREVLIRSLWGSPVDTASYRGKVSTMANFSEGELEAFLDDVGCRVMIRGHDHNIPGHSMYGGKLLTLISSSRYKDRDIGGILSAGIEIRRPVRSVDDLTLYRISEGDEWEDAEPNRT